MAVPALRRRWQDNLIEETSTPRGASPRRLRVLAKEGSAESIDVTGHKPKARTYQAPDIIERSFQMAYSLHALWPGLLHLSSVRRGHSFIWSDPILEHKLPADKRVLNLISPEQKISVSRFQLQLSGKWQIYQGIAGIELLALKPFDRSNSQWLANGPSTSVALGCEIFWDGRPQPRSMSAGSLLERARFTTATIANTS